MEISYPNKVIITERPIYYTIEIDPDNYVEPTVETEPEKLNSTETSTNTIKKVTTKKSKPSTKKKKKKK